jgi:hypothetical protein
VGQTLFTYDANNNRLTATSQSWNGTNWENSSRDLFTYDANNNMTVYIIQAWNAGAWENIIQLLLTYNANNNWTDLIEQNWIVNVWENSYKHIASYDANNNWIIDFHQNWNGTAWVDDNQFLMTYDAGNNYVSDVFQIWDGVNWANQDSSYYYRTEITGIPDINAAEQDYYIYPNPATTQFNIASVSSNNKLVDRDSRGEVSITDITGKLIFTATMPATQKKEVSIKDFSAGSYLVRIQSKNSVKIKKLVVIK